MKIFCKLLFLFCAAALLLSACTAQDDTIQNGGSNTSTAASETSTPLESQSPAAQESTASVSSTPDVQEETSTASAPVFDFETQRVRLNSGYDMPIVGLGTYALEDEECIGSVTALLESGGRLIDTASYYGTEESVGEAIRQSGIPREEIFVTTKLYPSEFSNAEQAIDECLSSLDIGYIDLLLLHHPGTGDVEAYHALEQAVADGKVRSIGLSNWYIEELEDFLPQVDIMPAVVQNEIHP